MDAIKLDEVLAGSVVPFGPRAAPSGIHKTPVRGRVYLGYEGLACDAQGDRKHHGGVEKALHHYAFEHYEYWAATIGAREVLDARGAFGENVSTTGVTEKDVAVGDTYRLGSAIIQVSQGRQPCWKLNDRFQISDMARRVQATGLTGWYYRVIEPGYIEQADEFQLVERLAPEWTVHRLWSAFYVDTLDFDELAAMAELALLAVGWRNYAAKRLATGQVEDWSARLDGHGPRVPFAAS